MSKPKNNINEVWGREVPDYSLVVAHSGKVCKVGVLIGKSVYYEDSQQPAHSIYWIQNLTEEEEALRIAIIDRVNEEKAEAAHRSAQIRKQVANQPNMVYVASNADRSYALYCGKGTVTLKKNNEVKETKHGHIYIVGHSTKHNFSVKPQDVLSAKYFKSRIQDSMGISDSCVEINDYYVIVSKSPRNYVSIVGQLDWPKEIVVDNNDLVKNYRNLSPHTMSFVID